MTAMTAVAASFSDNKRDLASAANAANLNNDEYKYQLLLGAQTRPSKSPPRQNARRRNSNHSNKVAQQNLGATGADIGTITNLLSGARTLLAYKDCEASRRASRVPHRRRPRPV